MAAGEQPSPGRAHTQYYCGRRVGFWEPPIVNMALLGEADFLLLVLPPGLDTGSVE